MQASAKSHYTAKKVADAAAVRAIKFHQTEVVTDKRPQKQQMWGEGVQY